MATGGKEGMSIDDIKIYELSLMLGVNPQEIMEDWDAYHVNRLLLILQAQQLSQEMRAKGLT
jgi:hypothetical protein